MKKTLLVLAGLLTATSAQAADLAAPAAEPVDYVRVCDAYGTGFFYIPGTETCLKIGGYVRVDLWASLSEQGGGNIGGLGWDDRDEGIAARARGQITFEAINNTDFGPLQSFISINSTVDHAGVTTNRTTLDYAWIKWAGFTFGFTDSFFTFYGGGSDVLQASVAGPDDLNIVWAYTAAFGNGISASLSIETPIVTRSQAKFFGEVYGGVRWPDVVANVKVEQAWGAAQVMGAIHHVYDLTPGGVDEVGYAIGAGFKVNIPGLGSASDFSMQAAYGHGAAQFVDPTAPFDDFAGTRLTTSWGVAAGLNLGFTDKIAVGVHGSYGVHDNGPFTVSSWTAMGDVTFRPVSGLQFRTGLEYRNDDFNAAAGDGDVAELVGFFRVQRSF